ncbi:MAG: pyrroline-5-carboxylate reductase [Dehalococcoidia bacterium]
MKVCIVGGGVMGEAILGAALDAGLFDRDAVTVVEKLAARRGVLASVYGVRVAEGYDSMAGADAVLLSVKPQEMASVHGKLSPGAVLISIMAGTTIASLQAAFDHRAVVRVMPNTPAAVKAGMSAWTATADVTAEQRDFVSRLLSAIGREIYFDDEKKLDMATAVSGSGPAYVFLFVESLVEGAVAAGLPRAAAEEMVLQTVLGSAQYALESGKSAADLRAQVTSPAGTTAAGLLALEKGAFRAAVIECVRAAHQRAIELGKS